MMGLILGCLAIAKTMQTFAQQTSPYVSYYQYFIVFLISTHFYYQL